MLFWIYILIAAFITITIIAELLSERNWKKQLALAMVLIPFILRILLIK